MALDIERSAFATYDSLAAAIHVAEELPKGSSERGAVLRGAYVLGAAAFEGMNSNLVSDLLRNDLARNPLESTELEPSSDGLLKIRKNSTDPRIAGWGAHARINVKKLRFTARAKVDRNSIQSAISRSTYNRWFQIDGFLKAWNIDSSALWDTACKDDQLSVGNGLELRQTLDLVIDRRNMIAHNADRMQNSDRFLPIDTNDVRDALRVFEAVSKTTCLLVQDVEGLIGSSN